MGRSGLAVAAVAALGVLSPAAARAQGAEWPAPGDGGVAGRPAYDQPEAAAPEEPAADCEAPTGFFLGLHGLLFAPFGEWIDSPLAGTVTHSVAHPDDLDQFGPGGGGIFEIGGKFCPRVGFSIQVDVSSLGTQGWVDYANANGSSISAWALQWGLETVFLVEAVREGPFRLEARIGTGVRGATGGEHSADYDLSWSYDFLKTGWSVRLGAGWLYSVLDGLDVVLLTDFVVGFPGADYADLGDRLAAWSFQAAAGIRFLPMEL